MPTRSVLLPQATAAPLLHGSTLLFSLASHTANLCATSGGDACGSCQCCPCLRWGSAVLVPLCAVWGRGGAGLPPSPKQQGPCL